MIEPHFLVGGALSDAPPPTLNLEVHPAGHATYLKKQVSSSHTMTLHIDSLKFNLVSQWINFSEC